MLPTLVERLWTCSGISVTPHSISSLIMPPCLPPIELFQMKNPLSNIFSQKIPKYPHSFHQCNHSSCHTSSILYRNSPNTYKNYYFKHFLTPVHCPNKIRRYIKSNLNPLNIEEFIQIYANHSIILIASFLQVIFLY